MKDQIIQFMGLTDYEEFDKYLIVKGTNAGGKPTCQIYNTNVKKLHKCKVEGYYFFSEESRDQHIADFKKRITDRNIYKVERINERRNFINPAQVGDLLYSSWGYDQTNIDFYQVIEVKEKSIVIREVAQNREYTEYMQGTCTPKKDHFIGEPMLKRVSKGYSDAYSVSLNSYASAWPYDGKAKGWTAYA
jgi:hypothetical protein